MVRTKPQATQRGQLSRLLAAWLALSLFAVFAALSQPRAAAFEVQSRSSSALRAAPERQASTLLAPRAQAVHIAKAALRERLPPFVPALWARFAACVSEGASPSAALGPGVVLGHFHGQRRIPRMNSEEPPRA